MKLTKNVNFRNMSNSEITDQKDAYTNLLRLSSVENVIDRE